MSPQKAWALPTDRLPTEWEEQCDFVRWFRRTYRPVRIFHVPNGDRANGRIGTRLQAAGVSAGVPDLYVPEWSLWIELKRREGGAVSKEQKDWMAYLTEICGHTTLVCHGSFDAQDQVDRFVIANGHAEARHEAP